MEQRIACKGCGQTVKVAVKSSGTVSKCPQCGTMLFLAPQPVPDPSASVAAPTSVPVAAVKPPPLRAETITNGEDYTAQQKAVASIRRLVNAGKSTSLVSDLRQLDWKAEVVPLSQQSLELLRTDFVFWSVSLLAIVPLLMVTLTETQYQLTGLCLFFAAIWGVIFKKFILEETGGWSAPLSVFFFTGLIGVNLLLLFYQFLPAFYVNLPYSKNPILGLLGFVFQVGLLEELCKILPVLAYLAWKRRNSNPLTIILLGVFSGLGFAAFENLIYADRMVEISAGLTQQAGRRGLEEGVQGAMVNALLRSNSLVFNHAVFSGIFAYFVSVAWLTQRRRIALFVVGWGVSALLHGLYDWLWGIQITLPALTMAVSFMLFYAYLTKLRLLIASIAGSPTQEPAAAT